MSALTPGSAAGIDFLKRDGSGATGLVLLHGIGSNAHSFDRLCHRLPGDWPLLSWNAPGYGGSARLPADRPSAAAYARRLHDLVEALALDRFVLVGHSLGTLIAAEFAALYPRRAEALILLACAEGYRMPEGAELPEKAGARLRDLERLGPRAFAEARAPRLLHDPDGRPDLLRDAVAAMAAIDPAGYAQAVHMLAAGDLAARVASVRVPSLVLVGAHDRITPPEQSRRTHEKLLSAGGDAIAEYREIDGAGHLVHQEKPDAVAAEIVRFVSTLDQPIREAAS